MNSYDSLDSPKVEVNIDSVPILSLFENFDGNRSSTLILCFYELELLVTSHGKNIRFWNLRQAVTERSCIKELSVSKYKDGRILNERIIALEKCCDGVSFITCTTGSVLDCFSAAGMEKTQPLNPPRYTKSWLENVVILPLPRDRFAFVVPGRRTFEIRNHTSGKTLRRVVLDQQDFLQQNSRFLHSKKLTNHLFLFTGTSSKRKLPKNKARQDLGWYGRYNIYTENVYLIQLIDYMENVPKRKQNRVLLRIRTDTYVDDMESYLNSMGEEIVVYGIEHYKSFGNVMQTYLPHLGPRTSSLHFYNCEKRQVFKKMNFEHCSVSKIKSFEIRNTEYLFIGSVKKPVVELFIISKCKNNKNFERVKLISEKEKNVDVSRSSKGINGIEIISESVKMSEQKSEVEDLTMVINFCYGDQGNNHDIQIVKMKNLPASLSFEDMDEDLRVEYLIKEWRDYEEEGGNSSSSCVTKLVFRLNGNEVADIWKSFLIETEVTPFERLKPGEKEKMKKNLQNKNRRNRKKKKKNKEKKKKVKGGGW